LEISFIVCLLKLRGAREMNNWNIKYANMQFPLTLMGVLAAELAQAGPSAHPPINMSENFPAQVSGESPSNNSILLKITPPFKPNYSIIWGVEGGPRVFVVVERNPNTFLS
jgi:hypothetical protein